MSINVHIETKLFSIITTTTTRTYECMHITMKDNSKVIFCLCVCVCLFAFYTFRPYVLPIIVNNIRAGILLYDDVEQLFKQCTYAYLKYTHIHTQGYYTNI